MTGRIERIAIFERATISNWVSNDHSSLSPSLSLFRPSSTLSSPSSSLLSFHWLAVEWAHMCMWFSSMPRTMVPLTLFHNLSHSICRDIAYFPPSHSPPWSFFSSTSILFIPHTVPLPSHLSVLLASGQHMWAHYSSSCYAIAFLMFSHSFSLTLSLSLPFSNEEYTQFWQRHADIIRWAHRQKSVCTQGHAHIDAKRKKRNREMMMMICAHCFGVHRACICVCVSFGFAPVSYEHALFYCSRSLWMNVLVDLSASCFSRFCWLFVRHCPKWSVVVWMRSDQSSWGIKGHYFSVSVFFCSN